MKFNQPEAIKAKEYPLKDKVLVALAGGGLFLLLLCFGTANRMDHYASYRSNWALDAPTKWTEIGTGKIVPDTISATEYDDLKTVDFKLSNGTIVSQTVDSDQADMSGNLRAWECTVSPNDQGWKFCPGTNTQLISANSNARPWDEVVRDAGHPETVNDLIKSIIGTLVTPAYLAIFVLIGAVAYFYDQRREAQHELWFQKNVPSSSELGRVRH